MWTCVAGMLACAGLLNSFMVTCARGVQVRPRPFSPLLPPPVSPSLSSSFSSLLSAHPPSLLISPPSSPCPQNSSLLPKVFPIAPLSSSCSLTTSLSSSPSLHFPLRVIKSHNPLSLVPPALPLLHTWSLHPHFLDFSCCLFFTCP